MGKGWDFSYNIFVSAQDDARLVHDGNTRTDTYQPTVTNQWELNEFFRVLTRQGTGVDETYKLTFEDTGQWVFYGLNDSILPSGIRGKIKQSIDRNGNTMNFEYDAQGRLWHIKDTLNVNSGGNDTRVVTIGYTDIGGTSYITSVTDWTNPNRVVQYQYYLDSDTGGSNGDLKSVTTPAVTTPGNFNDFPLGKTTTYTYSKGFADDQLNHNLLTITDPKGQTYLRNTYATTTNPNDLNYDRVMRQIWGDDSGGKTDTIDIRYATVTPGPDNGQAIVKAIVNDRVGNVREFFFDAGRRGVMERFYTGRADPDQPTTATSNRPTGKLRGNDPQHFETKHVYNTDSLIKKTYHPNGNITEYVYESDKTPSCDRRARGNLREIHRKPGTHTPVGDQTEIVELFEYNAGLGGCCFNFVTKHTDGRGKETILDYDDFGNLEQITYPGTPTPIETFTYNGSGQLESHTWPANDSGHRRVDWFDYYQVSDGAQNGYLKQRIVDNGGLNLTTGYQYDAVGNVTQVTQPVTATKSRVTEFFVNEINQVVQSVVHGVDLREGGPVDYTRRFWHDENDNLTRIEVADIDETGAARAGSPVTTNLYYEDILNHLTKVEREVSQDAFITTRFEYDDNRNLTKIKYGEAVANRQPNNVVRLLYDERNLLFQRIRAEGDPHRSTTQYDYDGNGNLAFVREGLEDTGYVRVTQTEYDAYDRAVTITDPMGNVRTLHYDPDSNVTSRILMGELEDAPGIAGNVRLAEASGIVYDDLSRRTDIPVKFFNPDGQGSLGADALTVLGYAPNSQLHTLTDANTQVTTIQRDNAYRFFKRIDTKTSWVSTSSYDLDSNPTGMTEHEVSDVSGANDYNSSRTYDILGRLATSTDEANKTTTYYYDSRDNLVKTVDKLGNEVTYEYDGLNRLVQVTRYLKEGGTGAGGPAGEIVTHQAWDDSSRLVSQTDAHSNPTTYAYDPLNRVTSISYADGTSRTVDEYDVHDNPHIVTDANGTVFTNTYDLLNRLTGRTIAIAPGSGVSSDTTFENFKYDGASNLVEAEDNDSMVVRKYDSMGNLMEETLTIHGASGTTVGTVSATHDGVGNPLAVTYPGGRVVTWTYDLIDQKNQATSTPGGALLATYQYAGPGRVERLTFGNNVIRATYGYDPRRRITGTTWRYDPEGTPQVLDDRTYAWDDMSNKTERLDVRPGGPQVTQTFGYDSAYRMTHSGKVRPGMANAIADYVLDGVGNRTGVLSLEPDAGPYTLSNAAPPLADLQMNQYTRTAFDRRVYDANGNLKETHPSLARGDFDGDGDVDSDDINHFRSCMGGPTVPPGSGCAGADLDGDGDVDMADYLLFQPTISGPGVVPAGGLTLTYDGHDQLVEAVDAAGKDHRYRYDALGRRIAKIIDHQGSGQQETRYFYNGWQVVEEQNAAGVAQATYVYGNYVDEPLTMNRGGQEYRFLADDAFNLVAVADASGSVLERYEYGDFGRPTIYAPDGSVRTASAVGNPYLFTGRRWDPETGLYYYRSRYYDPRAGRFISRDRIGIWGDSLNMGNGYAYVGNNPWSRIDPLGLGSAWWETVGNWLGRYTPTGKVGVAATDTMVTAVALPSKGYAAQTQLGVNPGLLTPDNIIAATGGKRSWLDDKRTVANVVIVADTTYEVTSVAALILMPLDLVWSLPEVGPTVVAGRVATGEEAAAAAAARAEAAEGTVTSTGAMVKECPGVVAGSGGTAGAPLEQGALTAAERAEIQAIADKYNTTIDVVGSRAAGKGRFIESDLPVGKDPALRSDIDFRVDTSHPRIDDLIRELKDVGNGAGSAGKQWSTILRPTEPPFIRFSPAKE